jgi:cation:H+ antiporter
MAAAVTTFVVSALFIVAAGTLLTHCADLIAERTGLGRLLIGTVLLAAATSLPELTVDIAAVRAGWTDLAVGDLIGSSLMNLLILAILDLPVVSRGLMLSRLAAGHALSGNVSAALTILMGLCLVTRPVSAAGEVLGVSYGIGLIVAGYVLGVRLVYYDQRASAALAEKVLTEKRHGGLAKPIAGFVLAAGVIVLAGPYLSHAAADIAELSGLGKTFVGTTLVAFSTSLPELVTSITAVRMGAYDLAIGNVFGSNSFNMTLLLPLDMVHPGPLLQAVSANHVITCQATVLATMVVVLGQLYQVKKRRLLIEPDAVVVIVILFGSMWLLYRLGAGG